MKGATDFAGSSAFPKSRRPRPSLRAGLAIASIILATSTVYFRSLHSPFVFDDKPSIVDNLTLHCWRTSLQPPGGGTTVDGRPVLNLSFALNYAWAGLKPFYYRATNVLLHLGAGLALFGLVRKTLARTTQALRHPADALPIATVVALLWCLHPLQTESVTYIVQRAESLVGLLLFASLYCFVASFDSGRPGAWRAGSVAICFLGMGVKETMYAAPLLILLYDRAFVAGGFLAAWTQRRRYYVCLAASWLFLGWLVYSSGGNRGGSRGFGLGIPWGTYLVTQSAVLLHYLRLMFWPHPLVFEYGPFWIAPWTHAIIPLLAVASLLALSTCGLWRKPAWGFLAAGFWLILAPTSLLPGATQMLVEHRLYIPLAAVVVVVVLAAYRLCGRPALLVCLGLTVPLGVVAARRNTDYRTEIALWQDTVDKRPLNMAAHSALGAALAEAKRWPEAVAEDEESIRLKPNFLAYNNLGSAFLSLGHPEAALAPLQRALEMNPHYADAEINLGVAADLLHQPAAALAHFQAAFTINPQSAQACNDLGDALSRAGRSAEGMAKLRAALDLRPDYSEARFNLAAALTRDGQVVQGRQEFERALREREYPEEAYLTWANVLLATRHEAEAVQLYQTALVRFPYSAALHYSYALLLAAEEKFEDSRRQFVEALRIRPEYEEAEDNLGNALLMMRREAEAVPHYEAALRLSPQNAVAHNNYGLALARLGRLPEAASHFAAAVELAPTYAEARKNLQQAQAQLGGVPP